MRASDRRWQHIVRFLQAYAYLDGKDAVTVDHCDVLPDLLWRDPASRPAIAATVAAASNPTAARSAEIVDAAKEKVANLRTPEKEPQKRAEWLSAASLAMDELDSMLKELAGLGSSRKVQEAVASVTKHRKKIAEHVNAIYGARA